MFSSEKDDWETPQDLFDELDDEFHFTLDAASSDFNAKCEKHYTVEDDGLSQSWAGNNVFLNPPYGRNMKDWMRKAYEESQAENTTVVVLVPARTDTAWFHDYVYGKAELRFLRGRLKFGGCENSAPFPSLVVVYR